MKITAPSPWNLPARLIRDRQASTFYRLFTSQHVVDLQLIAVATALLIPALIAIVLRGWPTGSNEFGAIPIAAILGAGASVFAWVYQTGSARLGIVDLFGCEITTLCRVAAIVEIVPRYVEIYQNPPLRPPGFTSQEQYTPVFDHNSKDLEVLEARVVEHVTAFYTYLKTLRDYLRVLSTVEKPQDGPEEWRIVLRSAVYMLFLMLESGREAVRRLVEYEPEREQNTITILLSELVAYGLLLKEFTAEAERRPGYDAKLERLRLRRPGYGELVRKTAARVRSGMAGDNRDNPEEWQPALALLAELKQRYQDAFGEPAPV
jgi:hypothetical protein